MWSGVDPDVELFASGDVAEEDDEWKGGHSLDGSSAPPPDGGQHTDRLLPHVSCLQPPASLKFLNKAPAVACVVAWQLSKAYQSPFASPG